MLLGQYLQYCFFFLSINQSIWNESNLLQNQLLFNHNVNLVWYRNNNTKFSQQLLFLNNWWHVSSRLCQILMRVAALVFLFMIQLCTPSIYLNEFFSYWLLYSIFFVRTFYFFLHRVLHVRKSCKFWFSVYETVW